MGLTNLKNKLSIIESGESTDSWYTECVNEGVALGIIDEKAKFSFLPKFRDVERDDLQSVLSDAESVLNNNGEASKANVEKVFAIIFKILGILNDIYSIFTLISCITIIGIILHLLQRAWVWGMNIGEEYFLKEQTKKTISQLNNLKSKTKNANKKAEIDKCIKKLKEKLNKVEKD